MNENEMLSVFTDHESAARSYCRSFPAIFQRAQGSHLFDLHDRPYIDFLSCAGAVNYGHNPGVLKQALLAYLERDGIQASLDMHSTAKAEFIQSFITRILQPRGLDYRLQFTSPTGTSVVESAIKLARKATSRQLVAAFTNGFHGMSSTALGLTGNRDNRQPTLDNRVFRLPYEGYLEGMDSLGYFERLLEDNSSGMDLPAAVILETVQGEGGIHVASAAWLQRLRQVTARHGILLIVDDIQAGCGRTGTFFSFEAAGIVPDMVCLSKSLSGYGLPFSLLLHSPALDCWQPGEDNGTFRGNVMAFVTARAALDTFWADDQLTRHITRLEAVLQQRLAEWAATFGAAIRQVRGRGLFYGIEFYQPALAQRITRLCFGQHLIIERAGDRDQVIKIMPALTISEPLLLEGLAILDAAMQQVLAPVAGEVSAGQEAAPYEV
jgi:diaminobutyrate-2-oxoglutarate transaminase